MKSRKKRLRDVLACIFLALACCLTACGKEGKEVQTEEAKQTEIQESGEKIEKEENEKEENVKKSSEEEQEVLLSVPSVCGKLSVNGPQLVDQQGEAVQLRGISTHGLAWYPQYVNEELFGELRGDWGANIIRLVMYTAESGGYCTDGNQDELKDLIRRGVEYAVNQDMYVIVDWHILSDNNPNQYKAEALQFFDEMSKEFSDHNNVLYEICNEPNGETSWGEIKSYANEIIPVIRANDSDAVILVGTPNWSQYVNEAAADPITGYENIMYTLHFYAATHTDSLRNVMTEAIEAGLPVFVSEFGICDASGNGGIDEASANTWVETMDRYQVSYVAWNLSNKEETSAFFISAADKVSGFQEEDISDSGRWIRQILRNAAGIIISGDGV